jgi:hypothetical protein
MSSDSQDSLSRRGSGPLFSELTSLSLADFNNLESTSPDRFANGSAGRYDERAPSDTKDFGCRLVLVPLEEGGDDSTLFVFHPISPESHEVCTGSYIRLQHRDTGLWVHASHRQVGEPAQDAQMKRAMDGSLLLARTTSSARRMTATSNSGSVDEMTRKLHRRPSARASTSTHNRRGSYGKSGKEVGPYSQSKKAAKYSLGLDDMAHYDDAFSVSIGTFYRSVFIFSLIRFS